MSFKHSYFDLEKSTKLDQNFIRRIMREVPGLRDRHTEKGRDGALFFDDNAVIILQQAAQLRAQKKSFKIITKLVSDSVTGHQKPATSTDEPQENKLIKDLVNRLEDSHKATLTAHQEIIDQLKQRILLLTDGRDPAEVRREREKEQAKLIQLERDKVEAEQRVKQAQEQAEHAALTARDLMLSAKAEQKKLELAKAEAETRARDAQSKANDQARELEQQKQELARKAQETSDLLDTVKTVDEGHRDRATKRAVLLDRLDQLSWFQWGRKRELLSQIRDLD